LARCGIFLGSTTTINYLHYVLQDAVQYHRLFPAQTVEQGTVQIFALFTVCLMFSSTICGWLSDRLSRRKPVVIGASLVVGTGLLLLAWSPTWHMLLLAIPILAVGFGAYVSVDLALGSQLVPEAKHRGKDVGLINAVIFVPMLVGPLLVNLTLGHWRSYPLFFLLLAGSTVIAALLILPIKAVR
jgi:MFS family permease